MKQLLLILAAMLVAQMAYADDSAQLAAACKLMPNYQTPPGVNYQPGVDVNGHYVAPADINGGTQVQMPQKINIPLTISLAKALNLNTNQYPYNQLGEGTEATLGTISVEGNNVTFNGQSLSGDQQGKLADLCAKIPH